MFEVSKAWATTYPGAAVGILAIHGVTNLNTHSNLDERKVALENELRSRYEGYDRPALKELPTIQAYNDYYKRFKKTYHVQLQLESILFKGKSIPRVNPLVEAMFMAELKHLLLTAGHDLAAVQSPIGVYVAGGDESFIRIDGQEQSLKPGDMYIADTKGILSSVIYGPDQRTRITNATRQVLYTVYTPPGIDEQAVYEQLQDIQANIILFSPEAQTQTMKVYGTG